MKWKKIGQIFDPTKFEDGKERIWMSEFAQCTSTLVFDSFVRVYFSSRPKKDLNHQSTSFTSFLDLDRKNLTRILKVSDSPILPLGSIGSFDEHAIYPTSVIRIESDIFLYYAGWYRTKSVPFNTSIGIAISRDGGEKFERLGSGPILSPGIHEPFVISGPKIRKFNGKWFLYYIAGTKWIENDGSPEIVYKIRMATSTDGIDWNRENRNLIGNILEEDECQAGPDVFFLNGKYHMYFVYRNALDFRNNRERGYRIGYATSLDLFNWIREDENSGIRYSEFGWDSQMMHYPHIFELDGNYYMLYNGNDFGKYGFGLAVLEGY
jgi:predicted GH43/DUF377 family glycosyl hydrolase